MYVIPLFLLVFASPIHSIVANTEEHVLEGGIRFHALAE